MHPPLPPGKFDRAGRSRAVWLRRTVNGTLSPQQESYPDQFLPSRRELPPPSLPRRLEKADSRKAR